MCLMGMAVKIIFPEGIIVIGHQKAESPSKLI